MNRHINTSYWDIPAGASDYQRAAIEQHNERVSRHKELLAKRRAERKAARAAEKEANKDVIASVKVGDVFSMSWGYDQTNVDFFQVIAKAGKSSVRIRQVCPKVISEKPGMMCATRKYSIPHDGTMLPPLGYRSVFIKDQDKGDVKRIQVSSYHSDKRVYLNIGDHFAYRETGDTAEHYESWYA